MGTLYVLCQFVIFLALSSSLSARRIRTRRNHVRSGDKGVEQISFSSRNNATTSAPIEGISQNGFLQVDSNVSSPALSPAIQLNSLILFSPRLRESNNSQNRRRSPCVVFFPGDVSDPAQNLPLQMPEYQKLEWTLEGLHTTIANRFKDYAVITVRGELSGSERSFNNLVVNPLKAIEHVEALLAGVNVGSRLVLVGFSRGGLGLTTLINGAEANPDFWRRVQSIHYVDVGGDAGWVSEPKGLSVLKQSNENIWLNFQLTPWCEPFARQRNLMITLARHVGLFVQVESAPVSHSFGEHMRILTYFNLLRREQSSQAQGIPVRDRPHVIQANASSSVARGPTNIPFAGVPTVQHGNPTNILSAGVASSQHGFQNANVPRIGFSNFGPVGVPGNVALRHPFRVG